MKAFYFLICASLPILIIFSNLLFVVYNKNLYFGIFEKTSVYSRIDKSIANKSTIELLAYFRGKRDLEHKYFSDQAISHLKDVKTLFGYAQLLLILNFSIVVVSAVVLSINHKYNLIKKGLLFGSSITVLIIVLFALLLILNFQKSFILFHKIAFTNNLWQFEESDSLIKLFPLEFFEEFAKRLFISIFLTSSIIAAICYLKLKND